MKITLKNVKFYERMSQETNCFDADLFVGREKIAYVRNDGCGGCTDITAYPDKREKLNEVEKYCLTLPPLNYGTFEVKMNLEHFVDELFENWLKEQEQKKMEKLYKNKIVFGVKGGFSYSTIGFKNKENFDDMLKNYGVEKTKFHIQQLVNNIKKDLKKGEEIFNTNLEKYGVKI